MWTLNSDNIKILENLCSCLAPSSRETHVQQALYNEYTRLGIPCTGDALGNLYATINDGAPIRVAIVAHADEIGFQITSIDSNGLLRFRKIGGIRCSSLFGHKVHIITPSGPVLGIMGYDPLQDNGTDTGIMVRTSDLWIDIGAETEAEARKIVSVGDFGVFDPDFMRLGANRLASKAFDDRVGSFVVLQAMGQLLDCDINISVTAISTVQEEIKLRGAAACDKRYDATLVLDVDFATDIPTQHTDMGLLELGKGVGLNINADSNPVLQDIFCKVAESSNIDYQPTLSRNLSGGTDATALQTSINTATLNINIPLRYMHTHNEVCDIRDIASAVNSVVSLVKHISDNKIKNYIPWQQHQ